MPSPAPPAYADTLLTYRQVSEILRCSLNTTRAIFRRGELTRIRVGLRGVRCSQAELTAYIQRSTRAQL